jgi:hypothetical protein
VGTTTAARVLVVAVVVVVVVVVVVAGGGVGVEDADAVVQTWLTEVHGDASQCMLEQDSQRCITDLGCKACISRTR